MSPRPRRVAAANPGVRCQYFRRIGGHDCRCALEQNHQGLHMAPGDAGDPQAVPGGGPYLVTWPGGIETREAATS